MAESTAAYEEMIRLSEQGESTLLCAVSGPLNEAELRACGIVITDEAALHLARRRYTLKTQPPLDELKSRFPAASPHLHQAVARLERYRSARRGSHGPEGAEKVAAAMRLAILEDRHDDAESLYTQFAPPLSRAVGNAWSLDLWAALLGSGRAGAAFIKARTLRTAAACMLCTNYAFTVYPKASPRLADDTHLRPGQEYVPEWLTQCLREADTAALQAHIAQHPQDVLAQACGEMLECHWESAHQKFCQSLGTREEDITVRANRGTGILAIYAMLCALLAQAPTAQILHWYEHAHLVLREELDTTLPEASTTTTLLENLRWFAISQAGSAHTATLPTMQGSATLIPLLLGYRYLPEQARNSIPLGVVLRNLQQLQQEGQLLLMMYGAWALRNIAPPDAHEQQELTQLLTAYPATLPPPQSYDPSGRTTTYELLETGIQTFLRNNDTRHLYWDLKLNEEGTRIINLQLRSSAEPHSIGHAINYSNTLQERVRPIMDEDDYRAVSLLQDLNGHSHADLRQMACLAGHPRVRLIHDNGVEPITLYVRRPILTLQRSGNLLRLTTTGSHYYPEVLRHKGRELTITTHPQSHLDFESMLQWHGSGGSYLLHDTDPLRTQALLNALAREYDIQGDIQPANIPLRIATPALLARLELRRGILCVQLLMQLLPDSATMVPPAAGLSVVLLDTPEGYVRVERDLEAEEEMLRNTLQTCPQLAPVAPAKRPLELQGIKTAERQADLLMELAAQGIRMVWQGKQRLRCLAVGQQHLQLELTAGADHWLHIGAHLKVDEDLILSLRELLTYPLADNGIRLPDGGTLLTDPALHRLLIKLRTATTERQGNTAKLHALMLPAWGEQQGHALPEGWQQYCPDLTEQKPDVPATLQASLRHYQLDGFRWLVTRAALGIGSCLADDMGLGKTLQTIALLLHRSALGPALVITPLSLLGNWEEETARFAPSLKLRLYSHWNASDPPPAAGELVLASYGQLTAHEQPASAITWSTLVLDEAQNIRNADTQRARTVSKLQAHARICLTGTPIENSLSDLWSLMNFLNPGMFGSASTFRAKCRQEPTAGMIRQLIRPLILRRTRAQVLKQLPALTESRCHITLSAPERALYESCRRHAVASLARAASDGNTTGILTELTRLRRLCCHAALVAPDFTGPSSKLTTMLRLLMELKAAGRRALVFSQFTDVLDLAEPLLTQAHLSYLRLDGKTSASRRTALVNEFSRQKADAFLISLKAGGVGLNLTAASDVILLDPWWNPAAEKQAAARSHRYGQKNPVTIHRLITLNTVEERVLELHRQKQEMADSFISEGSLPLDELRHLLDA